jgi:hypothetical protein
VTEVNKLKIFILFLALSQASVSLDETLTWLMNFSKEHGFKKSAISATSPTSRKLHINSLRVADGCSVVVEHEYFEPSTKIRKRTETISLGDFDPGKITLSLDLTDEADNPVYPGGCGNDRWLEEDVFYRGRIFLYGYSRGGPTISESSLARDNTLRR